MSPKHLSTTSLMALLVFTTQAVAQQCSSYCTTYQQILSGCVSQFGQGVQGDGDITTQAVDCMCVGTGSKTGFYEMSECYQCGVLTGDDKILNEAWILTCATDAQSSEADAVSCWNTQLLQGLTGLPCFQGSSSSSSGAAPSTVASGSAFPSASTAGSSSETGLGSAATTSDNGLGSASTSSEPFPTSSPVRTHHSSTLSTSAQTSSPAGFPNPISSTPNVVSSQQPQPTVNTNPTTSPSPTKSASGDRVRVSGVAFVIGVLALVVLL